jgi:V/A-type H+-transporting ATPase subunit D
VENLTPTKANLIKSKSMLEFSIKGYELLDKKRNVLIREMMAMIDEVKEIQIEIDSIFKEANSAMIYAMLTMGTNNVEEIALSIPKDENISILSKSIMGVEIPFIKDETPEIQPYYGFFRTNSSLDITVTKMNDVQKLLYKLAEVENSVFRLAAEIKKTSKRANALHKIQIPRYREMTKYIGEVLEEKEREDFFRLKRINNRSKD